MSFISEFKQFAMRGNVVDLAVAVVVGGAFGKVVSSLVSDIIMPPIGLLLGGVSFSNLQIVIKQAVMDGDKVVHEAVAIRYGTFLETIIDFVIIAFAIFSVIKAMAMFKKKQEAVPAPPPAPTKEETLLTEIRDILKSEQENNAKK